MMEVLFLGTPRAMLEQSLRERVADAATAGHAPAPVPKKRTWRPRPAVFFLGSLAFWLVLWTVAASMQIVPPLFLPSPATVAYRFVTTTSGGFADATLLQHAVASLVRVFSALALALLLGVPLGMGMGLFPSVRALFDPVIEAYRPIPPLAYLPLVVIWFGIGEGPKILLIFLAILPAIALSTAAGVRAVPSERINAARTLGASRAQVLTDVILPNALPDILVGARIGLAVGWSTLVAAELVAATRGLGFMIQTASNFLVTDVVIVGILTIAIIAFAMEFAMRFLERRLTPWKGKL
jgi:taurine transport system permease protein